MHLPAPNKLPQFLKDLVDQCRVSASNRLALARMERMWLYTGSSTGSSAIYNKLLPHVDKLASVLFAPADLRFFIEYENNYGPEWTKRGQVAGRYITREFIRRDFDISFGQAVNECLPHGCWFLKQVWSHSGPIVKLRPPWTMGVYREDEPDLDQQEAIVEVAYITEQELWRRISHRSDAKELFKRASAHARRRSATEEADSYIHQVMLAGTAPVIGTPTAPTVGTGGFVQLTTPNGAMLSPEVAAGLITFYEGYVVNDETEDYTTFQMVEPDIILEPRMIRQNRFIEHDHPYTKVCANPQSGYFWGRSELADLLKLQSLLGDRLEDIKRIMSLQYDGIKAFIGFSGMGADRYEQFREAGWIAEATPGAKIEDLTPKLPDGAFEEVKAISGFFDDIAGFDNVLSGKGEPGVRAGNHFQGLMRTASPRLRDRAIRIERQLTEFAEKFLWLIAAKDARAHWTQANDEAGNSDFYLSQLPPDTRVLVDSHSASPVYEADNANAAAFLFKAGAISKSELIDMLHVSNKDSLKESLEMREHQQAQQQAKLLAELSPEDRAKVLSHQGPRHR